MKRAKKAGGTVAPGDHRNLVATSIPVMAFPEQPVPVSKSSGAVHRELVEGYRQLGEGSKALVDVSKRFVEGDRKVGEGNGRFVEATEGL